MADAPRFHAWRPHPWHGLEPGPNPPDLVHGYIEITPFDLIKYEVDKATGYLKIDRPQRTSAAPPTLYGFVPRTYCGDRVSALCPGSTRGDGDPLDICIVSERPVNRVEILVPARVLGGLQMVDKGEADDKIVAVLANDTLWSDVEDISALPSALIDRLQHYFLTYKLTDLKAPPVVRIQSVYGRAHAHAVLNASIEDYQAKFGLA